MARSYRIAVADNDSRVRAVTAMHLSHVGYSVVVQAASGDELINRCNGVGLDLLIVNVSMPGTNPLEAAKLVAESQDIPVIAISEWFDDLTRERTYPSRVFSHLMKPIREHELQFAIHLAITRFEEFRMVRDEAANAQRALEDRKLIERAKGILMKQQGLDEQSAFAQIQQFARKRRMSMSVVAKSILLAYEARATVKVDGSSTIVPPPHRLVALHKNQ